MEGGSRRKADGNERSNRGETGRRGIGASGVPAPDFLMRVRAARQSGARKTSAAVRHGILDIRSEWHLTTLLWGAIGCTLGGNRLHANISKVAE